MCFVCGIDKPIGLHLKFYTDEEGRCIARFQPKPEHQGFPGQLHGGLISTLLERLMGRVKEMGIGIKRLFLDRGFAGIDVQTYLEQSGTPALIACTIRGKTGGTRALCLGHKSYSTTHTFCNQTDKKEFMANIAVCRVFTTAKRTGRMKRRAEWLMFILIKLELTPKQARRLYRRRFGVETSYRCAGQVRAWTTAKNPALRFVTVFVRSAGAPDRPDISSWAMSFHWSMAWPSTPPYGSQAWATSRSDHWCCWEPVCPSSSVWSSCPSLDYSPPVEQLWARRSGGEGC